MSVARVDGHGCPSVQVFSKGLSMTLRIMSFNLRYSRGKDGRNIWANRKGLVKEVLQKYNPDIIGFQEPLLDQMHDLREMLPEYRYIGVGREDGHEDGEFNPIFYKNLKIERSGTFWLSCANGSGSS